MINRTERISIIGSGVSGLSCALVLQSLGFQVTVYTKTNSGPSNPLEVSSFPSASIIPHSVQHPDLINLFKDSLAFFDYLYENKFKGITTHRHFELFAHKEPIPEYVYEMSRHNILDSQDEGFIKSEIEVQTGWEYECFFADWPLYFPELLSRFEQNGGSLIFKEITPENFDDINSEVVINCSEFGSLWLFETEINPIIYRGHLLLAKGAPLLKDDAGKTVSYNFTPGVDYYCTSKGLLQDVYTYPRKDGWILGGSRQPGSIDEHGNWKGENSANPTEQIDERSFPQQILSLNQSIISNSFGIDLDLYKERELRIGYRFMGNGQEKLRLESEEKYNRLIIHNYGHGGAGVTISWGCALRAAFILLEKLGYEQLPKEELFKI